MKNSLLVLCFFLMIKNVFAQAVPSALENTDFIVTFSQGANGTWGDDNHVQIYFFEVPVTNTAPFFIRVFDPEVGGKNDQVNVTGIFNSSTNFSIYGGKGAYSNKDARGIDPIGNYKSGTQLAAKTFLSADTLQYDNRWYSFGPFNPKDGEYDKDLNAMIFKIIVEGEQGDDGNMYRFFFSKEQNNNIAVDGGNAFAYEVTFHLKNIVAEAAHFFPYVDNSASSVKINNFDFDKDGWIRLSSVNKKDHELAISGDGTWESSKVDITKEEKNTYLDVEIIKKTTILNDMTINVTNQANEALPMFSYPTGGVPKYKYNVEVKYLFEK